MLTLHFFWDTLYMKTHLFSDVEIEQWISKVNIYVDIIANQIKKDWWPERLVATLIKIKYDWDSPFPVDPEPELPDYFYKLLDYFSKFNLEVSYIHTGSIPSQFGKPLMTLSELSPSFVRYLSKKT